MLLGFAIVAIACIAVGLFVGLLVVAKGKAAGVLCVEHEHLHRHEYRHRHEHLVLTVDPADQWWNKPSDAVCQPLTARKQLPAARHRV